MTIFILILLGLFVGIISTLFGIGGGSVILPVLFSLYPTIPVHELIASTLFVMFLNALISGYELHRAKKHLSKKFILLTAPLIALGALFGSILTAYLPGNTIKIIFSFCLMGIAWRTIRQKNQENATIEHPHFSPLIAISMLFAGILSSLTGLGGGVVFVPLYLNVLRLAPSFVTVYSNAGIAISTGIGLLGIHTQFSNPIQFSIAIPIFIASIFSARIGVKMGEKIKPILLRKLLALILFLVAIRLLWQNLFNLT